MKKLFVLVLSVLILFSLSLSNVSATCSGTTHACSAHNGDQSTCTAGGCNYNSQQNKCVGSHSSCSSFSDQSTCQTHSCTWTAGAVCGNGIVESGETCDDGNTVSGDGCSSTCATESGTTTPTTTTNVQKAPDPMSIVVVSPISSTYKNGENVSLKVLLTSNGNNVGDYAEVTSFFNNQTINLIYNRSSEYYEALLFIQNLEEGNYTIKFTSKKSGYYDAENSAIFFVNLKLDLTFSLEDVYTIGNEIIINGVVKDFRGNQTKSNVSIFGITDKIIMFKQQLQNNGTFEYAYRTTFFDIEGNWNVSIKAYDEYGNKAPEKEKTTKVKLVSEGDFYTVKFRSPAPYFVYKRGESFKIDVEATDRKGEKVEGANFKFRAPDGQLIDLKESGSGIYSTDYKLGFDAPEDRFNLYVIGIKKIGDQTNLGTAKLPITIEKVLISLDILSPTIEELISGKEAEIKIRAKYPDGSIAENLDIYFLSPSGQKISLVKELDNYVATYKIKQGEEGVWSLEVFAADSLGNSGSKLTRLKVQGITLFYKIRENIVVLIESIIAIVILSSLGVYIRHKKHYKSNLQREIKSLTELKKEAQTKYFKEGSINKETYQELMEKYEGQEADARKKLEAVKKKVDKKTK